MAEARRLICASTDLADGGAGFRFEVERGNTTASAFAVRHQGKVYAYINRCAHIGVELDWVPGRFFDDSGLYLTCATHGAIYRPDDGTCVAGPCTGARLTTLPLVEQGGSVFLESHHG